MLFQHLRDQKAFAAFLSTLIIVSTFSAVIAARPAGAATQAFTDVRLIIGDSRAGHSSPFAVQFKPGANGFTTEGATTSLKIGSPSATTTIKISLTGSTAPGLTTADVDIVDGFNPVAAGTCVNPPNTNAILPDAWISKVDTLNFEIEVTLCANQFLFSDSTAGFPHLRLDTGGSKEFLLPATSAIYDARIVSNTTDNTVDTFDTKAKYAVTPNVSMTGSVDPLLTFDITGIGSGVNIGSDLTTGATTATGTPMGTIASGTPATLAQKITLSTNAQAGAAVSVQAVTPLTSANGAVIDGLNNGSGITTGATFLSLPVFNILNDKTWGMVAGRSTNASGSEMVSGEWTGKMFGMPGESPAPTVLFGYPTPVPATVASTTVVYKAMVSDLQEAATDYKTELVYVVTPSF